MKIAVIGCGAIGARHAKNLAAMGQMVNCFDVDAKKATALARSIADREAFAPKDGLTYESDLDYVARCEAALICTPASTHAAVAKELLARGFDDALFVEKPLATRLEDCEVFESWPSPVLMVGYNWRFNFEVAQWQKSWRIPHLPVAVTLQCCTDMRSWPGSGYDDPALECSHELDLLAAMFGQALAWQTASCGPYSLLLDGLAGPVRLHLEVHWHERRQGRTFLARFADGSVERLQPTQASIDGSYVNELRHFLACVESNRKPDCGVLDGVRVLDTLAAMRAHV